MNAAPAAAANSNNPAASANSGERLLFPPRSEGSSPPFNVSEEDILLPSNERSGRVKLDDTMITAAGHTWAALAAGSPRALRTFEIGAMLRRACGVISRQFEGAEKPAAGLLHGRRNSHRTVQI